MPHLLNDPNHCVLEAIEGLCLERHRTVHHLPGVPNVVALRPEHVSRTAAAVICGGGSGHEPMHGGFVAPGMLSAAVCGRVFASPPISHVRAAIDYLFANGAPSVLVLVKRYTGDIINFGAAVEASRQRYGVDKVAMSVIGDDVTFGADDDEARGIAGTVLWYRLITAAANHPAFAISSAPASEDDVASAGVTALKAFADTACKHIRSMGASLQSCTLPGAAAPNAAIPEGEVEMGLGIHGERGSQSLPFAHTIDAVVGRIVAQLLAPEGKKTAAASADASAWPAASDFLVYANNLGGTTNLEMSVIVRAAVRAVYGASSTDNNAAAAAASVGLLGSGAICTSLNMHGFSLTFVNIDGLSRDLANAGGRAALFASPAAVKALFLTETPATNGLGIAVGPSAAEAAAIFMPAAQSAGSNDATADTGASSSAAAALSLTDSATALKARLVAAASALAGAADRYNGFDAACGDGDTGTGIAGASAALIANDAALLGQLAAALTAPLTSSSASDITAAFVAVGNAVCDNMAGSMGALLSIFIAGMAEGLVACPIFTDGSDGNVEGDATSPMSLMGRQPALLATMLNAGAAAVARVIGTAAGDRTFIDVTEAVRAALVSADSDGTASTVASIASEIVATVERTTEAVSRMAARKGRARYLGGREVGTRDPGAEIVGDFIVAIAKSLL